MHIKTVGNLLKQLLSYVMLFLSGFAVFVAFPLYILGHAFDQKNLLQLIWSWPSLLTVMLWGLWVRGFRTHRESFAWQIIYFLFVICSLRIIELQYDWSEEQEMTNALFCLMELMFVTALLVLEIIAWLNRRKPVRNNEFEINALENALLSPCFLSSGRFDECHTGNDGTHPKRGCRKSDDSSARHLISVGNSQHLLECRRK